MSSAKALSYVACREILTSDLSFYNVCRALKLVNVIFFLCDFFTECNYFLWAFFVCSVFASKLRFGILCAVLVLCFSPFQMSLPTWYFNAASWLRLLHC